MNFQTQQDFEQQLSNLLAFIILFEKEIETLRQKLAGNEEFHTRLVFQKLDLHRKGEIRAEDIQYVVEGERRNLGLVECQNFCRKHSISGALSYDELLEVIVPRNHKILAQRVMVRTAKRGASLPEYLWRVVVEMMTLLIKMTQVTEKIRRKIQNSPTNLSHLDMVYFFKTCLLSPNKLWNFCNMNSKSGEYSFEAHDAQYLSNHIKSGNTLTELTDQDIKEIICPLDMNFQKTQKQMGLYYQTLKNQKMKTLTGFHQTMGANKTKPQGPINFLNCKYNQTYNFKFIENKNPNYPEMFNKQINETISEGFFPSQPKPQPQFNPPLRSATNYNNMYIENFMKPSNANSFRESRGIDFDRFLINHSQDVERSLIREGYVAPYEKFQDDFRENREDSESAFSQY